MPQWKYSYTAPEEKVAATVKASLREVSISPKAAVEVCRRIKGMKLEKAKEYLEDVAALRRSVPFKRYVKGVGHRRDLSKWPSGRYPIKAAKAFLGLIANLENNAEFKGLDISRLKIIHASAHGGRKLEKYIPRAFGRSNPFLDNLIHVELVAEEV
ncbi:MAG: 50S ribosomal protein L22 [Nitrososphaeria archaeon]|nr:50S ribosomal protein L22 [Nitrososphaeria archaeon]